MATKARHDPMASIARAVHDYGLAAPITSLITRIATWA